MPSSDGMRKGIAEQRADWRSGEMPARKGLRLGAAPFLMDGEGGKARREEEGGDGHRKGDVVEMAVGSHG